MTKHIPIRLNRFCNARKYLLFVGGSNDEKTDFQPLIDSLYKQVQDINFISFTYREESGNGERSLAQQITDTKEVLDIMEAEFNTEEIVVFCTSMGAYPVTEVLVDKAYNDLITSAIFFDPADFPIDDSQTNKNYKTWSGSDEYKSKIRTISQDLSKVSSDVKVHVINSTLRNCYKDRYVEAPYKGDDNPELYPRLSNKMVESFYKRLSEKNIGEYIESRSIPHIFLKHGYVEKNIDQMVKHINSLLG